MNKNRHLPRLFNFHYFFDILIMWKFLEGTVLIVTGTFSGNFLFFLTICVVVNYFCTNYFKIAENSISFQNLTIISVVFPYPPKINQNGLQNTGNEDMSYHACHLDLVSMCKISTLFFIKDFTCVHSNLQYPKDK